MMTIKRTGISDEQLEINVIYGDFAYQNLILRIASPNCTPYRKGWNDRLALILTDWTGDGTLDLVLISKSYTGTNSTEEHILSGVSKLQDILLQTGTALEETDDTWSFGMGKWTGCEEPDLFSIKKSKTRTTTTEVHVLCGDNDFQNFVLRTNTGLAETESTFDFLVTDWNGDGSLDLVAVKKSRTDDGCTQVHVLSGESTYREIILRAKSPLFRSDGLFEFAVAEWARNGKPDLFAIKKKDEDTHTTEFHIMSQQD